MKRQIVQLIVLLVVIVSAASCTTSRTTGSRNPGSYPGVIFPGSRTSTQGMPPGQAKKVYGDQSAKKYAPGQQKKNNNGNGNGKGKKGKKH